MFADEQQQTASAVKIAPVKACVRQMGVVSHFIHLIRRGFSIHHGAHEDHEERRIGLAKRPDFNMIFSSFMFYVFSFENTAGRTSVTSSRALNSSFQHGELE